MKSIKSQLLLAFVCALLSFMLTYKFKNLKAEEINLPSNDAEMESIVKEMQALTEENKKLEIDNEELFKKLKVLEEKAVEEGNVSKVVKDELEKRRAILGISDVKGSGVILTISPKSNIFANNSLVLELTDRNLLYIVNQAFANTAEAVSINDKRITFQSGIKSSSNNSYILVNDEKVSPRQKITFKIIGNKDKLQNSLKELDFITYPEFTYYDIKIETGDNITIGKYNKNFGNNYIKSKNN